MAQKNLIGNELASEFRGKIEDNFTELYATSLGLLPEAYSGLATTTTTPVTVQGVTQWWLASGPGTYINFGGLIIVENFAILSYSGTEWTKYEQTITAPNVVQTTGTSTTDAMSQKAVTAQVEALNDGKVNTTDIEQVRSQATNKVPSSKLFDDEITKIINSGALYKGVATPTTAPGTPDGNVFYLATEIGTYANFGGYVHDGKGTVIFSNVTGSWVATKTTIATKEMTDLRVVKSAKGGNLLDQTTLESGWIDSSGVINASSSYGNTEFIPITEGETLKANFSAGTIPVIALYDINKQFISGVPTTNLQITGTASSKFVKWSVEFGTLNSNSAIYSTTIPSTINKFNPILEYLLAEVVEELGYNKKKILSQSGVKLALNSKAEKNTTGGNIFNPNDLIDGWVNSTGEVNVTESRYKHFRFNASEGEIYVSSFDAGTIPQIAAFNSSGVLISSVNSDLRTITCPANTSYLLWSCDLNILGTTPAIYKDALPTILKPYNPVVGFLGDYSLWEKENDILIQSKFNIDQDLTLVPTTYTLGIFEDLSQTTYHTSALIPIEAKENLNYFISFGNVMSSGFNLMRFYDSRQNLIKAIPGNSASRPKTAGLKYQINFPAGTAYIKYATRVDQPSTGLFSATPKTLQQCIEGVLAETKGTVLWLGTSIPEGADYPEVSCQNVGYDCINNSKGASFIRFDSNAGVAPFSSSAGFSLSATVAEKETKWRPFVTSGDITEAQLNTWKLYSYENLILPHLDTIDAIVIDHGYNDRYDLPAIVTAGENSIDWDSTDRTTFLGALRYLINEILRRKPFMKIILGGYFQNNFDSNGYNGSSVCKILEWAARHYNMPLLDAWNYSGVGSLYVLDTSDYISNFNTTYGTSYTKLLPDVDGNIMTFQLFCPDKVHPHSDSTGNSNKRLNAIFTKLIRDSLT